MFLSIIPLGTTKHFFFWQGNDFREEGELLENPKLFKTLKRWQEIYKTFCENFLSRGEIRKQAKNSQNVKQELADSFSELVAELNSWLEDSKKFKQADRKALKSGERALSLIVDPASPLALLPWEYCFLAEDYTISYSSPSFSSPANGVVGKGILGILGQMGEDDRQILEKYDAQILENPDIDTLCKTFRNCKSEIIYIGSHGDGKNLYFKNAVNNERLKNAACESAKQGAKMLIVNSCYGSGFVWMTLSFESFIIWKVAIPNPIARDFASFFFDFLSDCDRKEAFYKARESIVDKYPNIPSLRTLMQFWKRPDPALVNQLSVISHQLDSRQRTAVKVGGKRMRKAIAGVLGGMLVLWGGWSAFKASPLDERIGLELNKQGSQLDEEGRFDEATVKYKQASWFSDDGLAEYNLAVLLEDTGKPEEAYKVYEAGARKGDRGSVAGLVALFVQYPHLGDTESALKWLDVCLNVPEKAPEDKFLIGNCLIYRGAIRFNQKDWESAEEDLLEGIEVFESVGAQTPFAYCISWKNALAQDDTEKAIKWRDKLLNSTDHVLPTLDSCIQKARKSL